MNYPIERGLVIVPTYNEARNLPAIAPEILRHEELSLLIVDGNSSDGTGAIADELAARFPERVSVIHQAQKNGLGPAYVSGFRWGLAREFSYLFEMDCDFSHDPALLPRFLQEIASCDVVIGSRYVSGGTTPDWSLGRRLISRGGSLYARLLLGLAIHDPTGGFKCFRREVLAALDLAAVKSSGYAFQIEMNYRCALQGYRMKEIPIVFLDRRVGQSKMSPRIVLEALRVVWQLRRSHGKLRG